jgi:hypothetical protein
MAFIAAAAGIDRRRGRWHGGCMSTPEEIRDKESDEDAA